MKIYVIVGTCGSYDDVTTWNEVAYVNENSANEACRALNAAHKKTKWLGEHDYEVVECDLIEEEVPIPVLEVNSPV